jgi:predicted DNA-binding antitoxin AbrB/MazE fold protein
MTQICEAVYEKGVFKPLTPFQSVSEGQHVQLSIETDKTSARPVGVKQNLKLEDMKPQIRATPDEILALAAQVYEGWSAKEIEEFEEIILDRSNFRSKREDD